MYSDYEVKYVSKIDNNLFLFIGIGIACIALIVTLIGLSKVFKKANRSGVAAFIPIYNLIVLFEIVNRPKWQVILLLVPIVNIVIDFKVMFTLAKSFRKTDLASIGTFVFPYIYIPIIGFGSSEYMGINKEAMTGKSIAIDIPVITEKDIVADDVRNVTETKPMDISIGGGVYQKEYKESLLDVPEEEINKEKLASFRVETKEEQPQKVKFEEKTGSDLFNNINYVEVKNEEPKQEEPKNEETPLIKPDLLAPQPVEKENPSVVSEPIQEAPIEKPNLIEAQPLINEERIVEQQVSVEQPKQEKNNIDPGKCPHCGFPIKPGVTKCFMCGKDL